MYYYFWRFLDLSNEQQKKKKQTMINILQGRTWLLSVNFEILPKSTKTVFFVKYAFFPIWNQKPF